MSKFDDDLKLALRREEPSPDFTSRVMARIAQLPAVENGVKQGSRQENLREIEGRVDWETPRLGARNASRWWQQIIAALRPPQMKWAMAGAMAVLLIAAAIGLKQYRDHQQEVRRQAEIAAQAEGERAKEQVMLAMRIASAKLNLAQKKIQETTQHDDGQPQAEHQQN